MKWNPNWSFLQGHAYIRTDNSFDFRLVHLYRLLVLTFGWYIRTDYSSLISVFFIRDIGIDCFF